MVRLKQLATLFFILTLLLSGCQPLRPVAEQSAQEPVTQPDATTLTAIEDLIAQTMGEEGIPGLALGIVIDNQIAYTQGFGVERIGSDKLVTPHTIFGTGSIGKTAVATAIMQLVEAGEVDLDAPVTDYLPYFKLADVRYADITVYHLVTHRSGLPEVADWNPPVEYDDGLLERYIRSLDTVELLFAPGEQFSYSGMGFTVLADIIAKTSGQSFEAYVQEHIIDPLGMRDTLLIVQQADQARVTAPHIHNAAGEVVVNDNFPYRRQFAATGLLYASITDMARYSLAHLQRGELEGVRILPASVYESLWKSISDTGWGEIVPPTLRSIQSEYGMGWTVGDIADHFVALHVGADEGYQAAMLLAPDDHVAVVVNSNYFTGAEFSPRLWEMSVEIMRLLLTQGAPAASARIVRYASGQTIDNIDPAIGENYSINNALISLYDALFIVRGDTLENNLVDSYEASADASAFTFKLKENAKFHDGTPVNADAVVYSWQRMMRLQGPPPIVGVRLPTKAPPARSMSSRSSSPCTTPLPPSSARWPISTSSTRPLSKQTRATTTGKVTSPPTKRAPAPSRKDAGKRGSATRSTLWPITGAAGPMASILMALNGSLKPTWLCNLPPYWRAMSRLSILSRQKKPPRFVKPRGCTLRTTYPL